MKDKPVDLLKGTNKIQNCSKITLSKSTGKIILYGTLYKVFGLASQKVQTSSVLKPILNIFFIYKKYIVKHFVLKSLDIRFERN